MDPHDRSGWSGFERAVAAVLDRLGPGDVVTYGEVAAEAGHPGAARAVGSMLRRAEDDGFAWWRVVAADGRLRSGHPVEQARRLRAEGVQVRDGRIVHPGTLGASMSDTTLSSFAELGLCDEIVEALESRGISSPFPIQALTIPDALAGRDVCGKAKTGSGKTLAFGLPVLQRMDRAAPNRPTGLVLVPTRELANQVTEELEPAAVAVGRSALAIYGGAPIEKQIERLDKGVDLVVATPGRMIDLIERNAVSVAAVAHVVVDEADRMADMGFLPQVEWILRNVEREHQTLLFSATLDGVVNTLIRRYQHEPSMHEVASKEVTVEEMTHRFIAVHKMDKSKVAAAIAKSADRTIMFTRTKVMADRLARDLVELGVKAAAIHGDLRQTSREKSLRDFTEGKLEVLVATDVAARGIHVDDVDIVLQYDPPSDHKTYLHRAGRTARAGESGLVVTLSLWDEELEVKRLQKRIAVELPITEMFSNDARLADLAGWDPLAD